MKPDRDLPALTGIRFFLAIWVIFEHLSGPGESLTPLLAHLPAPMFTLIRGGFQAVTTFFVLSGFVLARNYAATQWNGRTLCNYWIARAARIYPVYLLSVVIMLPFMLTDPHPKRGLYIANYFALLQGWWPLPVGWNTPAWTLSCEAFFYTLFPLFALLGRRPTWAKTIALAAMACAMTRFMWLLGVSDSVKPLVHLGDFLMGIAAASAFELLTRGQRPPAGWMLYIPGFLGYTLLLAFPSALPSFLDQNTALRPMNALLLVGLGLGGGAFARFLSIRSVVYLGKSSYAMYILHIPILWRTSAWPPYLYILLVTAIAAIVHGFYEEPANRWLRRRLSRPAKA